MAVVSNRTPCNNKMFLKEINIPLINLIDKRRLFEFSFLLTRIVVSRYKIYSYMNTTTTVQEKWFDIRHPHYGKDYSRDPR